ncbi:DeoR/GlpR family DNA-binding transcription regulator [Catenisphaera adipataccumulans]|uniref:DeoR family fructose operon transcriptional repressor n=1 Tax=Catenisphaera adipataccumulans TaxID=700500 RepID=A0A7W8CYR7_9FIRM|nr:DeoR/GlpR family DNA-binding transcription regulator [Catenisphaera adipataccumulans]MBB5182747.1 DeoR family fructose operon transcriptional repressor [Catenisphaera adipataccumulans]
MSKQERWTTIIEICRKQQSVSVDALVDTLHVSPATVRRDLQQMEDLNMVERYHGGVRLSGTQMQEPAMMIKSQTHHTSKRQIAYTAAKLIQDNQMVYIDAGSTTYEMLEFITAKNITVVTPGIPHLQILGQRHISTIMLGGNLYWPTEAVAGKQAIRMMEEFYFDISFVGTNGIHERVGFTTSNELEADTKALGIRHSDHPYILADASKFNVLCPVPFADLDEAIIITDDIGSFPPDRIRYITTDGRKHV